MTWTPHFARAERPLAALDRLPRGLWLGALTNSQGDLAGRLAGLDGLRQALLDGVPAPPSGWLWPRPAIAEALAVTLAELDLPRFCRARADLTEQVLRSLVFHLDLIVDYRDRGAALERAQHMAVEAFAEEWRERCGMVEALVEVFGELGDAFACARWDLLRGMLRSGGWREVVRIRGLLERLPALSALIRRLGRALPVEAIDDAAQLHGPVNLDAAFEPRAQRHPLTVPELPGATRGVHRSGRFARMLASEAALLNHPRLRFVWHARHAERALLTYEDEQQMDAALEVEAPVPRPQPRPLPTPRLERGPLLVCVDTSASMQGGAEVVAKAVALEAMRAAHAQHRNCYLFAFGGPDEVIELDLSLDVPGIARLAEFFGQSFSGGTDISGPLERAIDKLEDRRWALADVVIASDGEFGATRATVARLNAAKQRQGLRVQGVLIGDRETIGLLEIADDVFWVRDWRRFGGSTAEAPVPSPKLTATYFPGALRSDENAQSTVSGTSAAEMVRRGFRR